MALARDHHIEVMNKGELQHEAVNGMPQVVSRSIVCILNESK